MAMKVFFLQCESICLSAQRRNASATVGYERRCAIRNVHAFTSGLGVIIALPQKRMKIVDARAHAKASLWEIQQCRRFPQ